MPSSDSRSSGRGGPRIDVEPLRYRTGDVIADKYRLAELLGEGGMGTVWRAQNLALGVDVAVKVVHGEMLSSETTALLRQEAHATARLEHPSAVRVFDLGETPLGDSFIVMELLRGRSLRVVLGERGRVPPAELVAVMLPVLSAVAAAHAKGIVHRDLKPENIMLVEDASGGVLPKVLDFGIAKLDAPIIATGGNGADSAVGAVGAVGAVEEYSIVGSPDYMSPEQVRGAVARIDARSDVWSLGVVLFEALAGRPPFVAPSTLALFRDILEEAPPTLESLGAGDVILSAAVARALAKDPEERWPDVRSFGRALAEWALANGVDTDVTGVSIAAHWLRSPSRASLSDQMMQKDTGAPAIPSVPSAPRRRRPLALAVAATALLAGIATFSLVRGPLAPETGAAAFLDTEVGPDRPHQERRVVDQEERVAAVAFPPSAAPTPSAAPSTVPSALPAAAPDASTCVRSLFPVDSFAEGAALESVCTERDPRRTAMLLRSAIAGQGLRVADTTEAMRIWALLSWYELAVVAVARGACCPADTRAGVDLPPSLGACPDLAASLDELAGATAVREAIDAPLARFRAAVACVDRGVRANRDTPSPYPYGGLPGGGAETAFRRIATAAMKRP